MSEQTAHFSLSKIMSTWFHGSPESFEKASNVLCPPSSTWTEFLRLMQLKNVTGQWNVLPNSSMAQRCKLELESFYSCSNAIFPKLNNWVEENITMIHQSALQRKTMVFENCQSEFPQTTETWKHDLSWSPFIVSLDRILFFSTTPTWQICATHPNCNCFRSARLQRS